LVAGYGIGSDQIEIGDKLCVLLGCTEPVILREVGSHTILIGDAFVPGYVDGKAVRGREAGTEGVMEPNVLLTRN
jgi:hypothetical protein